MVATLPQESCKIESKSAPVADAEASPTPTPDVPVQRLANFRSLRSFVDMSHFPNRKLCVASGYDVRGGLTYDGARVRLVRQKTKTKITTDLQALPWKLGDRQSN